MRGAHHIKGSALNLGCSALSDTAQALEELGRTGTVDGAAVLLDRLDREFHRTLATLREETEAA
jgi:HPt (histidine-containing phosphotransfer) domain-containing protein